jgi:hypothetical protein
VSEEPAPVPDDRRQRRRQFQKLRGQLAEERAAWSRWMPTSKWLLNAIKALRLELKKPAGRDDQAQA